jgi:hypothetical protein
MESRGGSRIDWNECPNSKVGRFLRERSIFFWIFHKIKSEIRRELHVARARGKLMLGNPAVTVEKEKYSYDVETAIDNLSSLPPRESVARCLEHF